jgi:hypothetical protein
VDNDYHPEEHTFKEIIKTMKSSSKEIQLRMNDVKEYIEKNKKNLTDEKLAVWEARLEHLTKERNSIFKYLNSLENKNIQTITQSETQSEDKRIQTEILSSEDKRVQTMNSQGPEGGYNSMNTESSSSTPLSDKTVKASDTFYFSETLVKRVYSNTSEQLDHLEI